MSSYVKLIIAEPTVAAGTPIPVVLSGSSTLPTGAATEAKQDTGNTSVASVDTKLGEVQASPTTNTVLDRLKALLTGIVLAAGSAIIGKVGVDQTTPGTTDSVTVKASEGIGALTETAPATDTASSGLNGRLQRIAQRVTSLIALLPAALGVGGGLKVDGSGTALPVSGTFYQATQPASVADGSDVTQGAIADAAVAAGATGSIGAKLRAISRDIVANIVLAAGSAIIGKVGIDQTTPGTTNGVQVLDAATVTVPTQIIKTVAAIATPEALAADGTFFRTAMIGGLKAARTANVGIVYLGIGVTNNAQPFAINPGEWLTLSAPVGQKWDLNDWGLDVATAGDGVTVIYS